MLDFFHYYVKNLSESDFIHALLHLFLKTHYDILIDDEQIMEKVRDIMVDAERAINQVEELMSHNACMLAHFTGIQVHK